MMVATTLRVWGYLRNLRGGSRSAGGWRGRWRGRGKKGSRGGRGGGAELTR